MHSNLFKDLRYSTYNVEAQLILHKLSMQTVSFNVFSVFFKFHFAYSKKAPIKIREACFFNRLVWSLKGHLKKRSEGEPLDLNPTRNKFLYCYCLTEKMVSAYSDYMSNELPIRISWHTILNYNFKFREKIRGAPIMKKNGSKNLVQVFL